MKQTFTLRALTLIVALLVVLSALASCGADAPLDDAVSSPSKGERAMADVLKQKLVQLGCEVREDDAAGKIPGTSGNRLNGFGK